MSELPTTFRCYYVTKDAEGRVSAGVAERSLDELPQDQVLIRVGYSSLNYKDVLAANGHPGVCRTFPHVPGVDAAGWVAKSGVYEFVEDDPVLVTGFDMGSGHWGGFAEYISVPAEWVVPLPAGLSLEASMILGTAGLTAAMCIETLQRNEIAPAAGPVVVTGASGGVGSIAVAILAKLGYHVVAVTGKQSAHELLRTLGAHEILPRDAVDDHSGKGLLSGRWAGAVDTVGGNPLSTILRACRPRACVAACGLTAGHQLDVSVYPFILRAVTLSGVDAAWCPIPYRHEMWRRLADDWRPQIPQSMVHTCDLNGLADQIKRMAAGKTTGRTVVHIGGESVK